LDSLSYTLEEKNGILKITDKQKELFGGTISGSVTADFTQKPVLTHISHEVKGMSAIGFLRSINSDEYLDGNFNYKLDLEFRSFDWGTARKSLKGSFHVSGENLIFYGVDLDNVLENFQVSKNFNVMNLSAVFVAGPYGEVFLKDMNFANMLAGYVEGKTEIEQLNSTWQLDNGIATAEDVAFRTKNYRVAMTGSLDMVNYSFSHASISMLNKDGCAIFSETINGPFGDPAHESLTVLGSRIRTLDDIKRILLQSFWRPCKPVYSGKVKHPGI
jgi:AsmA protein